MRLFQSLNASPFAPREYSHWRMSRGPAVSPSSNVVTCFKDYAINLARQMKPLQQKKQKTVGKYMDPQLLDHMSDEQIVQLYELHKAATNKDSEHDELSEAKPT
jgi:hypothetical protein